MNQALAIFNRCAAKRDLEGLQALKERFDSLPTTTPAYPDGLTQREFEVLRLLAQGKSNPEIAEELFISVNTVARHLTNIFTKIGAANRVEAATYASRQGLA